MFNEKYLASKEMFRKRMLANPHAPDAATAAHARVPKGQHSVNAMVPMAPIGPGHPQISLDKWELVLYGAVDNPVTIPWAEFIKLPSRAFKIDFHCVTTWSKLDQEFKGVAMSELLAVAQPNDAAKFVIFESYDNYTTNVPFNEILFDDVFVAFEMDGKPIPPNFGGPVRAVIPELYGWKSAKYVHKIRFQENDEPGFWEVRGYHNHADPWKEERFSVEY